MRYVISLPASRDLSAIADYFAQVNIAAGDMMSVALPLDRILRFVLAVSA